MLVIINCLRRQHIYKRSQLNIPSYRYLKQCNLALSLHYHTHIHVNSQADTHNQSHSPSSIASWHKLPPPRSRIITIDLQSSHLNQQSVRFIEDDDHPILLSWMSDNHQPMRDDRQTRFRVAVAIVWLPLKFVSIQITCARGHYSFWVMITKRMRLLTN